MFDHGIWEYYSSGVVVEDKKVNDNTIMVFPEEKLANAVAVLTPEKKKGKTDSPTKSSKIRDALKNGKIIDPKYIIKAHWMPIDNFNRKSAPDVAKGMTVSIYKRKEADEFAWVKHGMETDLNVKETVVYTFSNTDKFGEKLNEKNTYSFLVDTRAKRVRFRTTNNDGELTTYDIDINTKSGYVKIIDGKKNFIHLDSAKNNFTAEVKNQITLKAGKLVLIDTPKIHITGDTLIDKTLTVVKDVFNKAKLMVTGKTTVNSDISASGSVSDSKGSITKRT